MAFIIPALVLCLIGAFVIACAYRTVIMEALKAHWTAAVIVILSCYTSCSIVLFYKSGRSLAEFGQFGDSFGCVTSFVTLGALIGLAIQIKQTNDHHREEVAQHKEEMAAQKKESEDRIEEERRRHQEDIQLQKKQHEETILNQERHHKEMLEIQKMSYLSSERPFVQTGLNPLTIYDVVNDDNSTHSFYSVVWRFRHLSDAMLLNPLFYCKITDSDNKEVRKYFGSVGQLPYSANGWYELVFTIYDFAGIQSGMNFEMGVLYQNRLGGCFRYSETHRWIPLFEKTPSEVSASLYSKLSADSVFNFVSLVKRLSGSNISRVSCIRTDKPIICESIMKSDYDKEFESLNKVAVRFPSSYCLPTVDLEG